MRSLLLLAWLTLAACTIIKQDPSLAPIEGGQKRVETIICDNHAVGENGCVFNNGDVSNANLRIFKITDGSVHIVGVGCGINYSTNYLKDGNQWLSIDLRALLDGQLNDDCVLTILQNVKYDGADQLPYPVKALIGTVTLGICLDGMKCAFHAEQHSASASTANLRFDAEAEGQFMLAGCGGTVIPPQVFTAPLNIPLKGYLPGTAGSGCTFILGVLGASGERYKLYHKIWLYSDKILDMNLPALSVSKGTIKYQGDEYAMVTLVNTTYRKGPNGKFKASPDGDTLRFYSSQGRSLIVFVKDGGIQWVK